MSVSLSAGLLVFLCVSLCVCPSNGQTDCLAPRPLVVCLYNMLSVCLSIPPLLRLAACFQRVDVFSSVSPAFLSVCLSIHHVIPHPPFSPRWSWAHASPKITSPTTTGPVPRMEQSRQASPGAPSPPAPVSPPEPPCYSLSLPPSAAPPTSSLQPWSVIETFNEW